MPLERVWIKVTVLETDMVWETANHLGKNGLEA